MRRALVPSPVASGVILSPGSAGRRQVLPFSLIPPALASLPFTTADLAALQADYVAAIEQALSDNGSPALTAAQITAINAQLASAASRVPNVTNSSTLNFSTCQ